MRYPALGEHVLIYEQNKLEKSRIILLNTLKTVFKARFLSELCLWRLKSGEKIIVSLANGLSGIWGCPITSRQKSSWYRLSWREKWLQQRVEEDEKGSTEHKWPVSGNDFAYRIPCRETCERARRRRKELAASIHCPVAVKYEKRILYAHFRRSRKIASEELDAFLGKGEAVDSKSHELARSLLIASDGIRRLAAIWT